MNVIYEPKGRAREYAPLACNLYMGCTHGCKYCYAPACMHKKLEEWHQAARARGENVLVLFERDCVRLAKERADDATRRVLFCFLSDPYQPLGLLCSFFFFFHDDRSDWCEVVPHCGFDLHFPNN